MMSNDKEEIVLHVYPVACVKYKHALTHESLLIFRGFSYSGCCKNAGHQIRQIKKVCRINAKVKMPAVKVSILKIRQGISKVEFDIILE